MAPRGSVVDGGVDGREVDVISSIVVGVDGSAHADRALRHAIDEAVVHGAAVTVVFAHVHPNSLAFGRGTGPMAWSWLDEGAVHAAAQRELDDAVARAAPPDGVELRTVLLEAHPVEALLRAIDETDADLLVVGSRGRGGFRGLLLGSTSHEIVGQARCPVVVVPAVDVDDAVEGRSGGGDATT